MKAKIGKYKQYFGPYQLASALCFWVRPVKDEYGVSDKPKWVHKFGEWLAHGKILPEPKVGEVLNMWEDRPQTWLYKFLSWIHSKKKRDIKVQIDPWDIWNMDVTLGYIVRPMLKLLKEKKPGAPMVDLEDVPVHLHPTEEERDAFDKYGTTDEKFFDRWEWVMDEIIFAFESLDGGANQDWEEQFTTGEYDFRWRKDDNDTSTMVHGPNHTAETDWEGRKAYAERIQNGFRLFGKYFQSLWC